MANGHIDKGIDQTRFLVLMHASWLMDGDVARIAALLREPQSLIEDDISRLNVGEADAIFCGRPADWKPAHSIAQMVLTELPTEMIYTELYRRQPTVTWAIDDLRGRVSEGDEADELEYIRKSLEDRMTATGWDVIEDKVGPAPDEDDDAGNRAGPKI